MQTATDKRKAALHLTHLPDFAKFLHDHHLPEFVKEYLHLTGQLNPPILQYFESMKEEEFLAFATRSAGDLLQYIAGNRALEQIQFAKDQWLSGQIPRMKRHQVLAQDISSIAFIRKQSFLKFIPSYTRDVPTILAIVKELDEYILSLETILWEAYIGLLHERIDEHAYFIKRITETSPGVIYVYDVIEDREIYVNETVREFLGYTPEDIQNMGDSFVPDMIHPEDIPVIRSYEEEFKNAADGEIRSVRYRIRNRRGDYKWMRTYESVFKRDHEGRVMQKIGIAIDIHNEKIISDRLHEREEQLKELVRELRQSELDARESQHFIQKLADATPSIIASYNINTGKYRFVSYGLKKLLGYDPELPLRDGVAFFVNLVHPDDLGPIMEQNAKVLEQANREGPGAGEPIVDFEYRMRHENGEYRWFHTYGTVFDRNSNGQVEHLLNISIDVTFRKEMETALSQKNLQLEQSNANLEEFAYVASHDLKEPLRKISIFGDRLLSTHYQHLSNEGQFYLEKIIDSSRKMQVLINDLLSLSLITGNKSFVPYSLQDILDEVLRTLEYKIEEKGAVVHASELPQATIIPSQFRQLFQNLLTNSLKFIREGVRPEIHVRARRLQASEVDHFRLPKSKRYLEISFSDNGIGFDNMFAAKIFAIFQRLHHKEYEGTGIGLAICKKIVENHEGIIFATGQPGKGATFTFIIPQ